MSDKSLIEKLKSFTPDKGGLDRDAIIFAAGKASVRRRYGWAITALSIVQFATVVMLAVTLWHRSDQAVPLAVGPAAPAPATNPEAPAPKPPPAVARETKGNPDDEDPFAPPLGVGRNEKFLGRNPLAPPAPDLDPDQIARGLPGDDFPFLKPRFKLEGMPKHIDPLDVPDLPGVRSSDAADTFEVALLDGRHLSVKPIAQKLELYHVTPQFFERRVRARLAEIFVQSMDKVHLLDGIANPGKGAPFYWEPDANVPGGRIARSIGEPLDQLAQVEFTGPKGPQAPDLERMVSLHWITFGTVRAEKKRLRTDFEKSFGIASPNENRVCTYTLSGSRLLVRFDGTPARVAAIQYVEGPPTENADGVPLQGRGPFYRAVYQVDRDFLYSFLYQRYRHAAAEDVEHMRRYLDDTTRVAEWTDVERNELLANSN